MGSPCEFCVINRAMAENFQFKMAFVIPKERCCSYLKMGDDVLIQWPCPVSKTKLLQTVIVEDRWNDQTFIHKSDGIPLRTTVAGVYRGNAMSMKRKAELMSASTQQIIPDDPPYEATEEILDPELQTLVDDDGESEPLPVEDASQSLSV